LVDVLNCLRTGELDDHFGMGIRRQGAINPYGKADWDRTGVEPDAKDGSAIAPERAEKLAQTKTLQ
jgi:hypothetical protein